jgi:general secretion pathway protein G
MTGKRRGRGFTLIELLVVMAIIGMLLTIAMPRYYHAVQVSKETILRHDLAVMRNAIDKYYGDLGGYPPTLTALVDKRYIMAVPVDPLTQSADTWTLVQSQDPDQPGIRDLHSGSKAHAINGTVFSSW